MNVLRRLFNKKSKYTNICYDCEELKLSFNRADEFWEFHTDTSSQTISLLDYKTAHSILVVHYYNNYSDFVNN